MIRRWLGRWGPVLLWMAVIYAFSHMPADLSNRVARPTLIRKLGHLGEYATLGALLARAQGHPRWVPLAAGALYAASDEWHQTFVAGRSGELADVALDAAGVAIGVAAWAVMGRRWAQSAKKGSR